MPREFTRNLRVGAELQRLLNDLLQSEVKDPRLKDVRVSEVELSGDLGVARVFFSPLVPDADPAPVTEAFASASPFLRSRVGKALKLRRVPELRFEYDKSVARGMEISRLIADARGPADESDPVDD